MLKTINKKILLVIIVLVAALLALFLPKASATTTTSTLSITGSGSKHYTVEKGDSLEVKLNLPGYMNGDSSIGWESTNPGSFTADFGINHKSTVAKITPTTSASYTCDFENDSADSSFTVYVTVPGTPTPDYPGDSATGEPTPAPVPTPPLVQDLSKLYDLPGEFERNVTSSTGAIFTSTGPYAKFNGVWIHGYAIPSSYYTAKQESDGTVTVTLDSWYVNSLIRYEQYLIHLVFDDGYGIAKFTKTY